MLEKTKKLYISCRNILDILESGNIHDERYKLIIKSLQVEQAQKLQEFVAQCEDIGINQIVRLENEIN